MSFAARKSIIDNVLQNFADADRKRFIRLRDRVIEKLLIKVNSGDYISIKAELHVSVISSILDRRNVRPGRLRKWVDWAWDYYSKIENELPEKKALLLLLLLRKAQKGNKELDLMALLLMVASNLQAVSEEDFEAAGAEAMYLVEAYAVREPFPILKRLNICTNANITREAVNEDAWRLMKDIEDGGDIIAILKRTIEFAQEHNNILSPLIFDMARQRVAMIVKNSLARRIYQQTIASFFWYPTPVYFNELRDPISEMRVILGESEAALRLQQNRVGLDTATSIALSASDLDEACRSYFFGENAAHQVLEGLVRRADPKSMHKLLDKVPEMARPRCYNAAIENMLENNETESAEILMGEFELIIDPKNPEHWALLFQSARGMPKQLSDEKCKLLAEEVPRWLRTMEVNGIQPNGKVINAAISILSQAHADCVSILHVNIRSLNRRHAAQLAARLEELQPDILVLTETWLNNATKTIDNIPGYVETARRDRNDGRGGGVAVLCRTSVRFVVCTLSSASAERLWCRIYGNLGSVLLGAWYRPPHGPREEIISLRQELQEQSAHAVGTILVGDMNVHQRAGVPHTSGNTTKGDLLRGICSEAGLVQLVREPTRGNNTLDHVWTDFEIPVTVCSAIADHKAVLVALDISGHSCHTALGRV